jgi:hypothetical protein
MSAHHAGCGSSYTPSYTHTYTYTDIHTYKTYTHCTLVLTFRALSMPALVRAADIDGRFAIVNITADSATWPSGSVEPFLRK